jgi:hypothetical protein
MNKKRICSQWLCGGINWVFGENCRLEARKFITSTIFGIEEGLTATKYAKELSIIRPPFT